MELPGLWVQSKKIGNVVSLYEFLSHQRLPFFCALRGKLEVLLSWLIYQSLGPVFRGLGGL